MRGGLEIDADAGGGKPSWATPGVVNHTADHDTLRADLRQRMSAPVSLALRVDAADHSGRQPREIVVAGSV